MVDQPSAAQVLFPNNPSAGTPAPARADAPPVTDAARALFGNTPVSKPLDGRSPLGGKAQPDPRWSRPATLLGQPKPGIEPDAAKPSEPAAAEPFNPEMIQIEGM